jgi:hypothetical protein
MINWTDQHSANLTKCLEIVPLLGRLGEMRGGIAGATLEETAMSAKEFNGYSRCMNDILVLAEWKSEAPQEDIYVHGIEHFEDKPPPLEI